MNKNEITIFLAYTVTETPDAAGKNLLKYIRYVLEKSETNVVESSLYINSKQAISEITIPQKFDYCIIIVNENNLIHSGWLHEFSLLYDYIGDKKNIVKIVQENAIFENKLYLNTALDYWEIQKKKANDSQIPLHAKKNIIESSASTIRRQFLYY